MKNILKKMVVVLILIFFVVPLLTPAQELSNLKLENKFLSQKLISEINSEKIIIGEKLDPSDYGGGYVEHMDECIARDKLLRATLDADPPVDERHGTWAIPSGGATYYPHSGIHNVINKWGDTLMGIAFSSVVNVHGAWFAGQGGSENIFASSIRVLGYCNEKLIEITNWFEDISTIPSWFEMNLEGVDRIVIEANPVYHGAGWYAMDDFSYSIENFDKQKEPQHTVIDFEDCSYKQKLTDSTYAGLTWETGTGSTYSELEEKSTQSSFYTDDNEMSISEGDSTNSHGKMEGTTPMLLNDYQGVIRGDATSWSYPPDTCGVAGPNHFVETVNRNFAVYNKNSGEELINILLGEFLPGSNGDPRVLYDQYSDRWFVIVCDFDTKIFLAVSMSDDPTQDWFKCDFVVSQGADAGKWPDYPTLGVDEYGIYTAAYMIGGSNGMSIFALDKAPLIDENPSLGDIYAFRELPWEGAIQPVHTFGSPNGEYFVSRASSTSLRVRLLTNLTDYPVLQELCYVTIPSHSEPPDAPALGSTVPLDTVGHRLMNAVYRDGYIWTAHCIGLGGRAASRWYKIDVANTDLDDYGTIEDSSLYYYFPSIMVDANGNAIMGFTGSCSNQYAAAYYTGRLADDPPGEMASPVLLKEGEDTYNLIDGYGRNRWGDYSLCSLDPVRYTLWTIQEYAYEHDEDGENRWGTWICELIFGEPPETPTKPEGPEEWTQNIETNFSTSTIEPQGEDVYYMFEWGDGNYSDWVGPCSSGETGEASHSWAEIGVYEIRAIAKDVNGSQSDWSEPATLTIVENKRPTAPQINGKRIGFGGKEYEFTFVSTDEEGQDIFYKVDWDDGEITDWIGPYSSGEQIALSHAWNKNGEYFIKAWAKDIMEGESNQGCFKINILKDRAKSAAGYYMFLEQFPVLRFILGLY